MTDDGTPNAAVERDSGRTLSDYYVYGPLAIAIINGSIGAYELSRGRNPTGYLNATIIALFWFGTLTDFGGGV